MHHHKLVHEPITSRQLEAQIVSDNFSDAELHRLQSRSAREVFDRAGKGPWTTLYQRGGLPDEDGREDIASYSVLAPKTVRDSWLANPSWDVHIGWGLPGTIHSDDDPPGSSYRRFGNDEGWEPLVILPDGVNGREPEVLINQEFVLVFRLVEDRKTGSYIAVAEDGTEEVIIRRTSEEVSVRTSYLTRYRALKQLDLWLFTETRMLHPDIAPDRDFKLVESHWKEDRACGLTAAGVVFKYPHSTFIGKKFLPFGPIQDSRLWQFEREDRDYPEFIIGEDEAGETVSFTCEEGELANYFGKNPHAPNYLTPVFFRRDVLKKYYDNPGLYTVSDGTIRCGGQWILRLDNDHSDYAAVFLGDLGRDLPVSERIYWKSYNIAPVGPMSDTYRRRSINGEWIDAARADHRFRHAYEEAGERWKKQHGWALHRDLHSLDQQLLQTLHVPLNDGQSEFEGQILGLAKVLIEFLDVKRLKVLAGPGDDNEPSLPKLLRFLTAMDYAHASSDVGFLRNIQELRSKVAAHSKSTSYDTYIAKKLEGSTKKDYITDLFDKAALMMIRWASLSDSYEDQLNKASSST